MKSLLLPLLIACLATGALSSQTSVWNKDVLVPAVLRPYSYSFWQDGRLLLTHSKAIMEITPDGVVTGYFSRPVSGTNPAGFSRYLRTHLDPVTHEKYFLLGYRLLNGASNAMRFVEYRPGLGFVNEKILDETFTVSSGGFAVVELTDSSFLAIGNKFMRKLHVQPGQSVAVDWEIPLAKGDANAAVRSGQEIIVVTQYGEIYAMEENGHVLWTKPAGFIPRSIQRVSDGFITCGLNITNNKAVLAKFTPTGDVVWNKEFDDKTFESLLEDADGSIVVTGQSTADQLIVLKTNASGVLNWVKNFEGTVGGRILKTADGGYLAIGSRSAPSGVRLVKIDQNGNTAPYESGDAARVRNISNSTIRAAFGPSAALFFDNGRQGFFAPKDSNTTLFFASSFWIGGTNQATGDLHIAASDYETINTDYKTGPSFGARTSDFKRVWRVDREAIYQMRLDWADNGILDQPVPHDIATWPATGNTQYTQTTDFLPVFTDPSLFLAPFTDLNQDGVYNLADGDFPLIKGDEMAWWMLSDSTIHFNTIGQPLLADLAVSAYTYDHPGNSLEGSLFTNFQLINRSANTYENVYAGSWNDLDLGCPKDDYIGSIPASHAFFAYNQDNLDGQPGTQCDGISTFGEKIPIGSVVMLNQEMQGLMYYNNTSSSPPPLFQTSDPTVAIEYYNYLRGRWKDSLPLTYGESGYNESGMQPTRYAFPDNPADPNGWSMCSASLASGDRRILGTHGPFTFAPGDTFQLNLAYTYHPDIPHPCPDIYGKVKNDVDQLRSLVGSGILGDPTQLKLLAKTPPGQNVLLDATIAGSTYQWSTGATTPTITATQPGIYQVTITRANGYRTKEVAVIRSTSPVTNPVNWLNSFHVYPNPTAGPFTVELNLPVPGTIVFDLLNMMGETVRHETIATNGGLLIHSFDGGQLPAGAYTLRVRADGQVGYAKVAVQR